MRGIISNRIRRTGAALLLGVLGLVATGCGTAPANPPAPNQVLFGYLGHRAGVVEGFATWCMYCAYESAYHVRGWAAQMQKDHLGYVMLALDPRGGIGKAGPQGQGGLGGIDGSGASLTAPPLSSTQMDATLKAYRHYYNLQGIPMLANPALAQPLGLQGFPTYFFVRADGRIVHVHSGLLTNQRFTELVKLYLLPPAKSS